VAARGISIRVCCAGGIRKEKRGGHDPSRMLEVEG